MRAGQHPRQLPRFHLRRASPRSPSKRLVRFMAKKAVFDHKISGPLMRGMHHIPVDRKAGAGAYDEALAALRAGEVVGVFPEATISQSFEVKQLKTGAARMALAAGVPIVPVTIWGTQRLWTKGQQAAADAPPHPRSPIAVGPADRGRARRRAGRGHPADRRGAGDAAAPGAGQLSRPAVRPGRHLVAAGAPRRQRADARAGPRARQQAGTSRLSSASTRRPGARPRSGRPARRPASARCPPGSRRRRPAARRRSSTPAIWCCEEMPGSALPAGAAAPRARRRHDRPRRAVPDRPARRSAAGRLAAGQPPGPRRAPRAVICWSATSTRSRRRRGDYVGPLKVQVAGPWTLAARSS